MSNLMIENGAILITFMHCSMFLKVTIHAGFDMERNKTHIKVIKMMFGFTGSNCSN
jgi:hypothetical protein